jgi:hypothetical protein
MLPDNVNVQLILDRTAERTGFLNRDADGSSRVCVAKKLAPAICGDT